MITCPNQHASETTDFCSVCGSEISPPVPPAEMLEPCPDCGAVRTGKDQVFCEVCGRNFVTGKAGNPQLALAPEEAEHPPTPAPKTEPPQSPAIRWDVSVTVAANLYGMVNPDAPVNQPAQVFTLFDKQCLIGRAVPDIRQQIPIHHDPGVSRHQAMLVQDERGRLAVRDLGSANGTQLNGKDLTPGVETPVNDGDVIAVGAWTQIAITAVKGDAS